LFEVFEGSGTKTYIDGTVARAKKLHSDTLRVAIDQHVACIFESPRVGLLINKIFWDNLRERSPTYKSAYFFDSLESLIRYSYEKLALIISENCMKIDDKKVKWKTMTFSEESLEFRRFRSNFLYFRYCPAAMFFLEG
jgi:hypothetical protein